MARLAGVSAQTVSRVSNGATNVRPETRERVELAMQQLGYTPNRAARALRVGQTHTIGLMAHRFERTGEALTMKAVVEAAEHEGYAVTLIDVVGTSESSWVQRASRLSEQAMDALVIIRAEGAAPESLAIAPTLPIAVSDSRLAGYLPAAIADQTTGTQEAVQHLLELGHRTVHHISGPVDSVPAQVRSTAWQQTLARAGIRPPQQFVGDWSARSGYESGRQLALDPDVSAVFCCNDETAFGLMRALHEAGRRVPDDVSIIGFDDIGLAEFAAVPLTTVRQDFHAIGEELVRLVLMQVRGAERHTLGRTTVPTQFVQRASTAPPGPAATRFSP